MISSTELLLTMLKMPVLLFLAGFAAKKFFDRKRKKRIEMRGMPTEDLETVRPAVVRNGFSTNSIYHLYGHFQHFFPKLPQGTKNFAAPAIGYRSQGRLKIMLSDPLCEPEQNKDALLSFVKFGESRKRDTLLFAINEQTARDAKSLGYRLIKIGQEPVFDLKNYSTELLPLKLRSAIRQVFKKGIVIEEFSIHTLKDQRLLDSLDEVLHQWLLSRKSDEFKLMTEVNPLAAAEDKKFFVARQGESVEAFLACSPIYPRNGYFLHDLIRLPVALNGISEALVVTALETLARQGYEMATLGISPLAGLDTASEKLDYPWLQGRLHRLFERSTYPYNFKALYHFKKKFMPTSEEAAYLAIPAKGFRPRYVWGIVALFNDFNIAREWRHKLRQWQAGYNLPRPLNWAVDPDKIVLAPLSTLSLETLAGRLKITLTMLFLNVFAYVYTSDSFGHIKIEALESYGFSYQHLLEHGWYILFTSNFVHFHAFHLIGNMIALLLFTGALEILGGSTIALLIYIIGMQSNIPNGIMLLPVLKMIGPHLFHETVSFVDVGASLGIMATFGGVAYFLKPLLRYAMLIGSIVFFMAFSIHRNELIGFDHGFAVLLGYGMVFWYSGRQVSQEVFETTKFKFFNVAAHNLKLTELSQVETGTVKQMYGK